MGKMVRAGAGTFDKLEPEPHKNGPEGTLPVGVVVSERYPLVAAPILAG
jgi:hypothetical protein